MNNGLSREIGKAHVSTSLEHPASLQVPTMEMGSTLSETALEGATVSEAAQSEVKSRKKRFVSLLPLLAVLLMKRPQRESEETQLEVQKSVLASLLPLSYPLLPQYASMLPLLKELANEEKMVSGIAKRDQPSEFETETEKDSTS
jgi:hypothetical protein